MCFRQLPHHIASYYPGAVANYYITSTSFTQMLPSITTSQRHHFPDDVVNNPIISPPITRCCRHLPGDINIIYAGTTASYHITSTSFTLVLPPITISHRHHFPDDVVTNPITSPTITQVLSPINTSHCVLLPRCCRELPHRIDIISQMM